MNDREFFEHPGWIEIQRKIRQEISIVARPPEQVVLDDADFCSMLKISKRTAANLRASGEIPYHMPAGKVLYKLSDVFEMIERHRVVNAKK